MKVIHWVVGLAFFNISISYAKIKNVIFDFGGVLIEVEHKRTANKFTELGAKNYSDFHTQNKEHPIFQEFEKGELSPEKYRTFAKNELGIPNCTDEEFDEAFNAMIVEYRPKKLELVRELRKNFKVYLLSNTNQIHYDYFSKLFVEQFQVESFEVFNRLFDKAYYANFLKLKKPLPPIYNTVLQENSLAPEETLYIDDTHAYVEGARAVGMHVLFLEKGKVDFFDIPQYIEKLNQTLE